jgi:hypothetical protein
MIDEVGHFGYHLNRTSVGGRICGRPCVMYLRHRMANDWDCANGGTVS